MRVSKNSLLVSEQMLTQVVKITHFLVIFYCQGTLLSLNKNELRLDVENSRLKAVCADQVAEFGVDIEDGKEHLVSISKNKDAVIIDISR